MHLYLPITQLKAMLWILSHHLDIVYLYLFTFHHQKTNYIIKQELLQS